jgi:hypothetical protein
MKTLSISIIAICLLTFVVQLKKTAAQVPSYIPTNNLIGFWPLDSNFLNAFSPSHHGINSGAIPAIGKSGINSVGMRFNGTTNFATLPASVMSQINGSFTVSIWISTDSTVPNTLGYDPINDRTSSQWSFRFRLMFGQTNFGTYSPDSAYMDHINASGALPRAPAPYPSIEGWTHYVLVYDGSSASGVMRVYHNGVLAGTSPSSNLTTGARPINIGRGLSPTMPAGYGHFRGIIDEIAIWNRALSASEIFSIHQECVTSVSSQPQNQSVTIGNTATFSVTPTFTNASIQWQIDSTGGNWLSLSNGAAVTGATTTTLSLSNVGRSLNGAHFRALISDSSCTGSSQIATLTVNCSALLNQSPISSTQQIGNTIDLVAGSLVPGTQYQWQINVGSGFQNLSNFGQFTGVTSNTLTVANLTRQNNENQFRCILTNSGCADTSQVATITVLCNPLILTQPSDFSGVVGDTASFHLSQTPGATYAWYVNSGLNFNLISNGGQFSGATTSNLKINNLTIQNNNTAFIGVISEGDCSDTSTIAILRVSTGTNSTALEATTLKVYPNPVIDWLLIDLSEQTTTKAVRIFDQSGRLCFHESLEPGKHQVSTKNWASGVYMVHVDQDFRRIVVQHP